MPNDNVELIPRAYEAYARGDPDTMLGFVEPGPALKIVGAEWLSRG